MDHGHDDHGGMGHMCAMNMIWNTQIIDTCVVFPWWHIYSKTDFVFSFFAIMAIGIFYEWLRDFQRRTDLSIAKSLSTERPPSTAGGMSPPREDESLISRDPLKGRRSLTPVPLPARLWRATLYGCSIFTSFFLMLVFMTYNAYLILAVVLGAAAGNYVFGGQIDVDAIMSGAAGGKGMACH